MTQPALTGQCMMHDIRFLASVQLPLHEDSSIPVHNVVMDFRLFQICGYWIPNPGMALPGYIYLEYKLKLLLKCTRIILFT